MLTESLPENLPHTLFLVIRLSTLPGGKVENDGKLRTRMDFSVITTPTM